MPFRTDTEVRSYVLNTSRFEPRKGRIIEQTRIPGRGLTWYMFYPDVPRRGDHIDVFCPMYYSRGPEQIRSVIQRVEALKKVTNVDVIPAIFGAGTVEDLPAPDSPTELRAQLLATAMVGDGAIVYSFFAGGRTWTAVAQACHEIARLEPLLIGSKDATILFHLTPPTRTDDVKVLDSLLWRGWHKDGTYVLAVFNLDPKQASRFRLHAYLPDSRPYELVAVRADLAVERTEPMRTCDAIALRRGVVLEVPGDYGLSLLVFRPSPP